MTVQAGTRLGPYEILDSLGAGGMGEVYRARDTRLQREVAIKVLPPELADDLDALARFEREAQAVAAISHPNILAIFDFGRHEGISYTVTELLEGETLRQRMERINLSPRQVVDIASQIVRGLEAAHGRRVIHRDLKPDNVFVTRESLVKILDFGLAKQSPGIVDNEAETEIVSDGDTMAGTIVGTLGYMSPEQLQGDEVDHRCDLFSLGTLLYEMLSGQRPFQGKSAPMLMGSIMRDDPPPISDSGVFVSPALQRIVQRCLEKRPQERFQTARDLLFALEAISDFDQTTSSAEAVQLAEVAADEPPSVAVLPFANMSPDPEQEYFCEGMAEEVLNALMQIEDLRVAARASAFQFKDKAKDIQEVGRKLNVKTVLDGSVRMAGNRLRVMVQLIAADSGYQIWSNRYDREMEDIFAIQDEISESIVEALQDKLVKREIAKPEPAARRPTESLEAYQLFLKGQHNWYKREHGSLMKALRFFEQAVELDPDYVQAHIGIANAYTSLSYYGMEPGAARERAEGALVRARSIEPELPELWAATGFKLAALDWGWHEAELAYRRAIAEAPQLMAVYCWYNFLLGTVGRHEEAIAMTQKAVELDPLSSYALTSHGLALSGAGRHADSIAVLEEARELDADYLYTQWMLVFAYGAAGRCDDSIEIARQAVNQSGRNSYYLSLLGWSLGLAGRRSEAEALLKELRTRGHEEYVSPIYLMMIYSGLGDTDQAFVWLQRGLDVRFTIFNQLEPFRALQADPRYASVWERMGISR